MNKGVASHEGCHVYGWLDVKRVAANFHISVHVEDYMLLAQVHFLFCITMKIRHVFCPAYMLERQIDCDSIYELMSLITINAGPTLLSSIYLFALLLRKLALSNCNR